MLSIVTALGADKEKPFQAAPVDSYPCRQTIEKVTIAADPFDKEEKTSQAFGKLDPNRYGILPVLVVIRNGGAAALSLEAVRVEYITESRRQDRGHAGARRATHLGIEAAQSLLRAAAHSPHQPRQEPPRRLGD